MRCYGLAVVAIVLLAISGCADNGAQTHPQNNRGDAGGFDLCSGTAPTCLVDCGDQTAGATCVDAQWQCPDGSTSSDECTTPSCHADGHSNLPGVHIELDDSRCTWTQQEAQAGVDLPYRIVVDQAVAINPYGPASPACQQPGDSGLITQGRVDGDAGAHYCKCDVGMCPRHDPAWNTLQPGTYEGTFHWSAYNWDGPSDTGNPFGDPFAPGAYTVTISSSGQQRMPDDGTSDFDIVGSLDITLTASN